MRLVFAGTPEPALTSLEALLASRHEVVAVITRPDARAGRGRAVTASPVARRASAEGLETLRPASAADPSFLARLRQLAPDACPIVAYGALLRRDALAIPARGWINLHFSPLPAWRGAAPVQHTVLAGDDLAGATTFLLEEGMDTGPVYGVVTERVHDRETSGELLDRLARSGAELLVRTLDGIEDGTLEPRPQPEEGVSYAPKLAPEDARVDWTRPAVRVDRLVRACTPAPGAWTPFRGERLKLGPVLPVAHGSCEGDAAAGSGERVEQGELAERRLAPGELRSERGRVLAGTGTYPVQLGEVQPPGKRRMPATDWVRGLRLAGGERLG